MPFKYSFVTEFSEFRTFRENSNEVPLYKIHGQSCNRTERQKTLNIIRIKLPYVKSGATEIYLAKIFF